MSVIFLLCIHLFKIIAFHYKVQNVQEVKRSVLSTHTGNPLNCIMKCQQAAACQECGMVDSEVQLCVLFGEFSVTPFTAEGGKNFSIYQYSELGK